MKISRILITGATGFLGSNLAELLLENGYVIAVLKRSTSDLSRLRNLPGKIEVFDIENSAEACLSSFHPDCIIHCATDYGRKNSTSAEMVRSNLVFPLQLLELCKKFHVACFINTDTALEKDTNNYSLSKKQFREWLEKYSDELLAINLELEHFYGPGDDQSKFVTFLIDSFLKNAPELNLTAGEQKRDFTYIGDVARAYLFVLKLIEKKTSGFFNFEVASGETPEIRQLVEKIRVMTGNGSTKVNLGAVPYRKNEKMGSHSDTSAIRALGWAPEFSLDEGLKLTIEQELSIHKSNSIK